MNAKNSNCAHVGCQLTCLESLTVQKSPRSIALLSLPSCLLFSRLPQPPKNPIVPPKSLPPHPNSGFTPLNHQNHQPEQFQHHHSIIMSRSKKAEDKPKEGATLSIDVDSFVRTRDSVSSSSCPRFPVLLLHSPAHAEWNGT